MLMVSHHCASDDDRVWAHLLERMIIAAQDTTTLDLVRVVHRIVHDALEMAHPREQPTARIAQLALRA